MRLIPYVGLHDHGNRYQLWLDGEDGGKPYFANTVSWVEQTDDSVLHHPAVQFRREEAQRLMDELWKVGLRPSEGSGSAGQLAAVQTHLNDMRGLVAHYASLPFDGKTLGVTKP